MGQSKVALGVLDIDGSMATAATLAPVAESAGYSRYWFTEHQPQATPLLPAALLLGLTETLRVGTAGILLGYHNVYRVAQDFRFLHLVYPDRVDAGFCGGHVEDTELVPLREPPSRPSRAELEERAATLVALLRDELPEDHAWRGARQISKGPSATPWSLGTSMTGAHLAAKLGVPYAHSLFHLQSQDRHEPVEAYRERFVARADECRVALAIAGVCARTDDAADKLRRKNTPFVPTLLGGVARWTDVLGDLRRRYAMDDLVFLDLCEEIGPMSASYELIAEAASAAFGG